jgi:hypothetical protein
MRRVWSVRLLQTCELRKGRVLRPKSSSKVGAALGSNKARESKSDKRLQLHFDVLFRELILNKQFYLNIKAKPRGNTQLLNPLRSAFDKFR